MKLYLTCLITERKRTSSSTWENQLPLFFFIVDKFCINDFSINPQALFNFSNNNFDTTIACNLCGACVDIQRLSWFQKRSENLFYATENSRADLTSTRTFLWEQGNYNNGSQIAQQNSPKRWLDIDFYFLSRCVTNVLTIFFFILVLITADGTENRADKEACSRH